MYINSVTNNGYKHTETIFMQKASDRYKETYRSVPKRMDSLEISSEAYEMRNKDEKMSATSGTHWGLPEVIKRILLLSIFQIPLWSAGLFPEGTSLSMAWI